MKSYEYHSILDMNARDALAHLIKYGIIKERTSPLLGWTQPSNEKKLTILTISYLHTLWVCHVENGVCVDVWPVNYEGEE